MTPQGNTTMKSALEWLNEVGETVANDCFSPDAGVPGRDTELLIGRIQSDAYTAGRVAGLREAARIVNSKHSEIKNAAYNSGVFQCVVFIEAELDRAEADATKDKA
jgi:hypothetical protein